MIFYYDKLDETGTPIPNLSSLDSKDFDKSYPWVVQLRLLRLFNFAGADYNISTINKLATPGWYPIGISWFDFTIDYFELISTDAMALIRDSKLKVLFYYHEGDNPALIKHRIDQLCQDHGLENNPYKFVSANTAASKLENFVYFGDHECFFNYINRNQLPITSSNKIPSSDFTVLTRIPKDWRALIMSRLWKEGVLEKSVWSFNTVEEKFTTVQTNNPIEISKFDKGASTLREFLKNTPKQCDVLDSVQQNDHTLINTDLHHESYCNIVLETHFDADQSDGTFLTEKIWKCIKYGQPFVVAGPAGTISHLRELGYNTYDNNIDHSYDDIENNTDRAAALIQEILRLKEIVNSEWLDSTKTERVFNLRHFKLRYQTALNNIIIDLRN